MLPSSTPQQQRALSHSLSPQQDSSYQGVTEADRTVNGSLRRKSSFSFLRRSKSRERSTSGSNTPARKLSKKDRSKARQQQDTMQEQMPSPPPRIPIIPHPPDLQGFGGDDIGPDVMSNRAGGSFRHRLAQKTSQETLGSDMYRGMPVPPVPPIPPIPGTATTAIAPKSYTDTFSRTESLMNRGRYSYASSAISTINSPRKIRRRRDPTPFK